MTDSCATCRFYVSGDCRLEPPLPGATRNLARLVAPDFWCGEFSAAPSLAVVPIVMAASATTLYFLKSDGTLWATTNSGVTWTSVVTP